jgi:5'-nucleotidase
MGSRLLSRLLVVLCFSYSISAFALALDPHERLITILQTNDIHGAIGGLAYWSGVVTSFRKGLRAQFGERAGVVLVDGGDQFQGTLVSNFTEGQLIFSVMNRIGYDAVVPGNHDYDFGPIGWLEDQVSPASSDKNPRGALLRLAQQANFPLLSANTYFKSSLVGLEGSRVAVEGSFCKPLSSEVSRLPIDWSRATRPTFLQPYVIKEVAGLRVALIGIDHPTTPVITTPANVSDLCFRDEADTYAEVRTELEGKADLFVMVIHNGNIGNEKAVSKLVARIMSQPKFPRMLDAVTAGHTHTVNNESVSGVPIVQSGTGGKMFGRIDLIWDTRTHSVVTEKTHFKGGIPLDHDQSSYEGVEVSEDAETLKLVETTKKEVAPLSLRVLGQAESRLSHNTSGDMGLGNAMTDVFRELSGADVSLMNVHGLRAPLEAGPFTYESFFQVLPFNNHGVVLGPVSGSLLLTILRKSISLCENVSKLAQSGLKVTYEKNCRGTTLPEELESLAFQLLRVELVSGEVIYDRALGIEPAADRTYRIATLDFLYAGGSGFSEFGSVPLLQDLGILREEMTREFLVKPAIFSKSQDDRWKDVTSYPR